MKWLTGVEVEENFLDCKNVRFLYLLRSQFLQGYGGHNQLIQLFHNCKATMQYPFTDHVLSQ